MSLVCRSPTPTRDVRETFRDRPPSGEPVGTSRENLSDLSKSRENLTNLSRSRENMYLSKSRENMTEFEKARENIINLTKSRENLSQLSRSRENLNDTRETHYIPIETSNNTLIKDARGISNCECILTVLKGSSSKFNYLNL